MRENLQIFLTGATGYIGGSVAARMVSAGHRVQGLVRSSRRAEEAIEKGIEPVIGTLDDDEILRSAVREASVVINTADSDHLGSVRSMMSALKGSNKLFIHTSGSSIVGTQAGGERVESIFDEKTPFTPSPGRVDRVRINELISASTIKGIHTVIICPSLIYGLGRGVNLHSMHIPWLINVAEKYGVAKHIGSGENLWSNVHIDDLVELYLRVIEKAPPGSFYFVESGENSMRQMCEAINRAMGNSETPQTMTIEEASKEWGDGPAKNTMGSNSRVRAVRARKELFWAPTAPTLIEEIEHGCYKDQLGR